MIDLALGPGLRDAHVPHADALDFKGVAFTFEVQRARAPTDAHPRSYAGNLNGYRAPDWRSLLPDTGGDGQE